MHNSTETGINQTHSSNGTLSHSGNHTNHSLVSTHNEKHPGLIFGDILYQLYLDLSKWTKSWWAPSIQEVRLAQIKQSIAQTRYDHLLKTLDAIISHQYRASRTADLADAIAEYLTHALPFEQDIASKKMGKIHIHLQGRLDQTQADAVMAQTMARDLSTHSVPADAPRDMNAASPRQASQHAATPPPLFNPSISTLIGKQFFYKFTADKITITADNVATFTELGQLMTDYLQQDTSGDTAQFALSIEATQQIGEWIANSPTIRNIVRQHGEAVRQSYGLLLPGQTYQAADHLTVGINFLRRLHSYSDAKKYYVCSGVLGSILDDLTHMLDKAQPNEPVNTFVRENGHYSQGDIEFFAEYMRQSFQGWQIPVISISINEGARYTAEELAHIRSFDQHLTTAAPAAVTNLVQQHLYVQAAHQCPENDRRALTLHFVEQLQTFAKRDEEILNTQPQTSNGHSSQAELINGQRRREGDRAAFSETVADAQLAVQPAAAALQYPTV